MVTYHRIILPLTVGGTILIGIAINMLKLKKIKTADMVISLFMPLAVMPLLKLLA